MSTIQTTQVEDYTPYLQQLSEGKKKRKKAALEQAYRNNLAAITKAEEGLDGTYRSAANAAAGSAAVGQRNFEQYAAANGLTSGAAGQARLAGDIALQNNLNTLEKQKASDRSELALQKTTAEQEYQSGLAAAEAEAEEDLAQTLYEESVRRAQAQYQANRDAVKDEQWQKELEFAIQKYWYDNGYLTPPTASGGTGASGTPNTDLQSVAMQVIRGDWGNGTERKNRLTAAGYDYAAVQALVDAMLAGK